ncbi:hypothetical protein D3C73_858020 [compost metagenome]
MPLMHNPLSHPALDPARLAVLLLAGAGLGDQSGNQRAFGQVFPEPGRQMALHHFRVQPRRVEDVAVVGQPHVAMGIVNVLSQLLPLNRAFALVDKLLAIVVNAIPWRSDQPAVAAHAADEMLAGTVQDVVRRFVPGDIVRPPVFRQRNEPHKCM